ncbi:MAG: hypothetical protein K8R48_02605 [Alphaproteobacteria bacterium]|nr:hypothetical protein [Alphaproteobacteria bacterium]
MTNDDLDTDIDIQEEPGTEPPAKPSLKDVWESSPMLKIAAVVLGIAMLVGVYVIFFAGGGDETKSLVSLSGSAQTKQIPGQQELDPAYRKALVEANVQTAKEAVQTGGSALPTPISTTKTGGLDMPGLPEKPKTDPLAEWRGKALNAAKEAGISCPRSNEERLKTLQKPGHVLCPDEIEAISAMMSGTGEGAGGAMNLSGADALLAEARRCAAAGGGTVEQCLAKMAAERGGSDALLDEARRRALANGTTIEEELAKMAAERAAAAALLEEAKRCAAAGGGTVEQCLEKIRAQKALLDEARRRAAANGTTLEEELAKMAAERAAAAALLEEAKRCAAANPGMTVEKCLEKIKAENALLEEAKRCAAAGGGTLEQCLAKLAEKDPLAKALLDEARRRAAANGTTVEAELARMAAEKAAAAAALEEARRRAAANGTTVEEELAKMAAEKAAAEALLEKAKRCAAENPGMTVDQCLKKIEAELAALEEAKRRAAANGTTVEEELAKMAAEKALMEAAKRCAAENPGMTVEKYLEKIKAERAMLDEAKRRAAANGTTVEEELAKMAAEAAAAAEEAKRKLADEAIRNLAAGGGGEPSAVAPPMQPSAGAAGGAGAGGPQAMGRVMQTPEEAKEAAKALLDQMRVIISAQTPPKPDKAVFTPETSPYNKLKTELQAKEAAAATAEAKGGSAPGGASAGAAGAAAAGAEAAGETEKQTIVPAGSIAYAQLLTELNSDIMGPALVQILSGPFAGGRAIGKVKVKEAYNEYMVLTFTTLVKDGVSYKMNGIAMDENTTLTGQATDVDHHYLDRIILPAAAKFVEGYGGALAKTGSTVAPPTGAGAEPVTVAEPKPSPKEGLFKGLEESTKVVTEIIGKSAERPVTVKIAKGTTMGIFFIDPVTTGDAGK